MRRKKDRSAGVALCATSIVTLLVGVSVFSFYSLAKSDDAAGLAIASVDDYESAGEGTGKLLTTYDADSTDSAVTKVVASEAEPFAEEPLETAEDVQYETVTTDEPVAVLAVNTATVDGFDEITEAVDEVPTYVPSDDLIAKAAEIEDYYQGNDSADSTPEYEEIYETEDYSEVSYMAYEGDESSYADYSDYTYDDANYTDYDQVESYDDSASDGEWVYNYDTDEWEYIYYGEPAPDYNDSADYESYDDEDYDDGEWVYNYDTDEWEYVYDGGQTYDDSADYDSYDDEDYDDSASDGEWVYNYDTDEWEYVYYGDQTYDDSTDYDSYDYDDSDDYDSYDEDYDDDSTDDGEWVYNYDTDEWEYVYDDDYDSYDDEDYDDSDYYDDSSDYYDDSYNYSLGQQIVNYAMSFVGVTPYVWAGRSLYSGTDCSGFVNLIYADFGIYCSTASLAYDGSSFGYIISYDELQPGDIVVYGGGDHVAIYAGNGYVVHCSSPENGTVYWNMYYRSDISWFLRVL